MLNVPVPEEVIDLLSVGAIGTIATGTSGVLANGADLDTWLQLVGIIVAAILAFLRGRNKPKK